MQPRVAIITPYFKEKDSWLEQGHASVKAQTYPCEQIFVADGHPNPLIDRFDAQHIRLSFTHDDFGDTPRAVASLSAISQGFDAIAYLDADNWYVPTHVENLVNLHRKTGAQICTSGRAIYQPDGMPLVVCLACDGEQFCDTGAMLLFKETFPYLSTWALMPPEFHPIGDRVIWFTLKQSGLSRAHRPEPTLSYRHVYKALYRELGLPVPPEAREPDGKIAKAMEQWRASGRPSIEVEWRFRRLAKAPA
jgi:glycosyltransferase involved in cell wall biosynthesis